MHLYLLVDFLASALLVWMYRIPICINHTNHVTYIAYVCIAITSFHLNCAVYVPMSNAILIVASKSFLHEITYTTFNVKQYVTDCT